MALSTALWPKTFRLGILIIDDDVKLCRLIANYLQPLGYAVTTEHTGRGGLTRALNEKFPAILLDVMLPDLHGFDLLRELRQHSQVPVLMLTTLGDEADRIVGLEMGADDYLPKAFSRTVGAVDQYLKVLRVCSDGSWQKDSVRQWSFDEQELVSPNRGQK